MKNQLSNSTPLEAEFCQVKDCRQLFGLHRSIVYRLLDEGAIRSISLRRRGMLRGKRLIEIASVRKFFAGQPSDIDPKLSVQQRKNRNGRFRHH